MSDLDRIDRKLLRELQADGRATNVELAERVSLSHTPCLRRVRKLEANGVIKRYTAIVDPGAVGLHVGAFAFVKLDRNTAAKGAAFERSVAALSEVMECCVVTGGHDYVLRIVAEDLGAYERFLKERLATIEGVDDIETMIILSQTMLRPVLPL